MRKKYLSLIPALALVLMTAGCMADEIFTTDEAFPSGDSSSTLADPGLAWSESAFEATIGEQNSFPTLSNSHNLSISYSSSQNSVATIDEEGNITLLSAGTTAIMATSGATDTYASGSASYALTVVKGSGAINWNANSCTVNIGELTHTFPTLYNPGNQTVSYTSSNESVATISSDGTVTLVAEGSTTITAFKAPSGLSSFAVTAPSLKSGYKGVTVSGTTYSNGIWATSGISGGTSVSLSTYSGGGSGPGGGYPGGPGGGGFPW